MKANTSNTLVRANSAVLSFLLATFVNEPALIAAWIIAGMLWAILAWAHWYENRT